MPDWFVPLKGSAILYITISSGKHDKIVGLLDGRLRIKISKQPIENKANKALIKFLSKKLGVSKSKIKIVAGEKYKRKIVLVDADIKSEQLYED